MTRVSRLLLIALTTIALLGVGIVDAKAKQDPVPTPSPPAQQPDGERQPTGEPAPPTPDQIGAVIIRGASGPDDDRDDIELLSAETGVPVSTIRQNIAVKNAFVSAVEVVAANNGEVIARVTVPDIVTGAPGEVVFVGEVPERAAVALSGVEAVLVGGALFSEADQERIGNIAAVAANDVGLDWTAINASPWGITIEVIGAPDDRVVKTLADSRELVGELDSFALRFEEVVALVEVTEENRLNETNTTNGGAPIWTNTGTCTSGFTVAFGWGGQALTTAGHCTQNNAYVWEQNVELNQFHLYRTVTSTFGGSTAGDVARMIPVMQWQLDQWYGTNVYLQGDPEPYFMANYTYGKRQVHAEHDPQNGEYVCYVGRSNTTRTCGHYVVATHRIANASSGAYGNLTYTTVAQNLMVVGSSGGTVSYNNSAFGIIHGTVVTGSPVNGWAAGSTFNVFTPMNGVTSFTGAQTCTTNNYYCYGTA